MPFTNHNDPHLRKIIDLEQAKVRDQLRKLRHAIEHGNLSPPVEMIRDLGHHAATLSQAINQVTVRHELLYPDGRVETLSEGVLDLVAESSRANREYVTLPVIHPDGTDDYSLYRDELGFSEQEYKDLVVWKEALKAHETDAKAAFDQFSSVVVRDLQAGKYSIKPEDLVPGVAGVVGIAVDVGFFVGAVAAAPMAVPTLVSSCMTGLAAIAMKFPDVRKKLLGRGRG